MFHRILRTALKNVLLSDVNLINTIELLGWASYLDEFGDCAYMRTHTVVNFIETGNQNENPENKPKLMAAVNRSALVDMIL